MSLFQVYWLSKDLSERPGQWSTEVAPVQERALDE